MELGDAIAPVQPGLLWGVFGCGTSLRVDLSGVGFSVVDGSPRELLYARARGVSVQAREADDVMNLGIKVCPCFVRVPVAVVPSLLEHH